MHESETWVFAASRQLADLAGEPSLHRRLQRELDAAGGPEGVNDGPDTAPAKRLKRLWPQYLPPAARADRLPASR